ncbi:multiple epidermal growth factor-like domains protein 11 [Drosophila virilis]|nr:multiple epidermal growth factor-like domains protein 11 [Drosophila virilis]
MLALRVLILFVIMPGVLLASFCEKAVYVVGKKKPQVVKACCNGYRYVRDDKKNISCKPICNEPCSNGSCVSPNTCSCNQGYENLLHMPSKGCVPRCSNKCLNGQCIAPETCSCDAGYQLDKSSGRCAPICSTGCPNGFCESPGKCSCSRGYSLASDQTCVPDSSSSTRTTQPPVTTESDSFSFTGTTQPQETTMTDYGFIKNWQITHLMAIVMLLALIVLGCLMKLRHRRITSEDFKGEKEVFAADNKLLTIDFTSTKN